MAQTLESAWLRLRLDSDELTVYTAVRLARRDLAEGRLSDAVSRLRSEADKIRVHDAELASTVLAFEP